MSSRLAWRVIKLCRRLADYPFVQRTTLVAGLTLAFTAATLGGIAEWVDSDASRSAEAESSNPHVEYASASIAPLPAPGATFTAGNSLSLGAPGYTIRRDVPEVRLAFTVADERGRLIRDLTADDLRVYDDQLPVEKFHDFYRNDDLPLRLGIVLDASDSVKRVLPQEKAAALQFLQQVLRPQTDKAFVMAFGSDVEVWQDSTSDRAGLLEAVGRVKQPGNATRLFDALYSACRDSLQAKDDSQPVHRVLVVLTDGDDTDSLHQLSDVVAMAQRSETQIYALTVHGKRAFYRGDYNLQNLADETGGRLVVASSARELEKSFATIQEEIRSQYYVSFPPQSSTPGFHALQVQVSAAEKLNVHARHGYYALPQ